MLSVIEMGRWSLEDLITRSTLVIRAAEVATAALPIATPGTSFLGEPVAPYDKRISSLAIHEVLYANPCEREVAAGQLVRVRQAEFELFLHLHREYHLRRLCRHAVVDALDPALAAPPAAAEALFFLRPAADDPDATHELVAPGAVVALRFRHRVLVLATAHPRHRA